MPSLTPPSSLTTNCSILSFCSFLIFHLSFPFTLTTTPTTLSPPVGDSSKKTHIRGYSPERPNGQTDLYSDYTIVSAFLFPVYIDCKKITPQKIPDNSLPIPPIRCPGPTTSTIKFLDPNQKELTDHSAIQPPATNYPTQCGQVQNFPLNKPRPPSVPSYANRNEVYHAVPTRQRLQGFLYTLGHPW